MLHPTIELNRERSWMIILSCLQLSRLGVKSALQGQANMWFKIMTADTLAISLICCVCISLNSQAVNSRDVLLSLPLNILGLMIILISALGDELVGVAAQGVIGISHLILLPLCYILLRMFSNTFRSKSILEACIAAIMGTSIFTMLLNNTPDIIENEYMIFGLIRPFAASFSLLYSQFIMQGELSSNAFCYQFLCLKLPLAVLSLIIVATLTVKGGFAFELDLLFFVMCAINIMECCALIQVLRTFTALTRTISSVWATLMFLMTKVYESYSGVDLKFYVNATLITTIMTVTYVYDAIGKAKHPILQMEMPRYKNLQ